MKVLEKQPYYLCDHCPALHKIANMCVSNYDPSVDGVQCSYCKKLCTSPCNCMRSMYARAREIDESPRRDLDNALAKAEQKDLMETEKTKSKVHGKGIFKPMVCCHSKICLV